MFSPSKLLYKCFPLLFGYSVIQISKCEITGSKGYPFLRTLKINCQTAMEKDKSMNILIQVEKPFSVGEVLC